MNEQNVIPDELRWVRGRPGDRLDENRPTVKAIGRLLKHGETDTVRKLLRRWHPRDIVELLVQLPLKRARKLFLSLPPGPAAKVIAGLNDDFRAALLEDATIDRLIKLFDSLDPEDAVDAIDELPEEVQARLLPHLRDFGTISELMTYKEDSAGGIMTRKFVVVPPDWTVDQVINEVRRHANRIKKLSAVYVVDADRRLTGYLKLRDLLLHPSERQVADIMRTDYVAVRSDMDQEEVVRITERNDLASVPVVDADGRLLGRITSDELQRVVRDEAEEDLHLLSGISPDTRPDEPVLGIVRNRLPWLLAGLVGATVSGSIVGSFQQEIAAAAILASFIPMVMSMAGNAGIQAATVAIQGLATGTIWLGDLPWRLGREVLGALINGLAAGIILAAVVLIAGPYIGIQEPALLALTAGLALAGVTLLAAVLGATIPLLLNHFGIDPAMATGIFITTGNDILAVLIFFVAATAIYL
ncbi:magnesium transporter [Thiohalocapsa marina]|uniref:Magnesium transporter MgtE n=1 Tax=Thiohalocapsa marina TaxID=424902 RepID=A0A5M8FT99_9GAMM|nr:magnesium transporter [Thiohalocapsa marina]KAA6187018.1 magnesium transporter [Thiohalocapsa marina]